MSLLTRQEIDLREKMAAEIEKAAQGNFNMLQAIGVIREPINHNSICPCSLCVRWVIKSWTDECSKHRKITLQEATKLADIQSVNPTDEFDCGWCNFGQNNWKITELLWDIENEFPITPCCHTEATEAFEFPEDEDEQRKEDEQSYRYSITGKL